MSCIFCKIVNKEIPAAVIYEDDQILAFRDVSPQAPAHVLVIPKEHIASVDEVTPENCSVVAHIFARIPEIAKTLDVEGGYRVVTNCEEEAGQTVFHLHFHILGGRRMGPMG